MYSSKDSSGGIGTQIPTCSIIAPSFRNYKITIYDKDFNLKKIYKDKYHIIRHDSSILDFEDENGKLYSIIFKDGIIIIEEQ